MGLGAYWGDFAKGFADREDYWRDQKRKDQASLATAATTLNNYIRQNPQATEADIEAFARNLHPSGASGILGAGGLQRAYQANQEVIKRQKEDRDWTRQQREQTEKNNHLEFSQNKRELFEKQLTLELDAQPYGQNPRQEADIRAAGQRALQKLKGMHPEIDFTDIEAEYSYLSRAQKVAQNRAKRQQEAAEIVRSQIIANPQAYAGENNKALAKLREDTRVKFGFAADVQLVPDQEVAALVMDGVRKKAVEDAEQNASALSDVYNQLGERALAAKNPEALMRDAEQILSMNYDEQMVAHLMQGFDPERARQMAESSVLSSRTTDMLALSKQVDTVPEMLDGLGIAHLNVGEEFKARLQGYLNQNAGARDQTNREFLGTAMNSELSDPTRILRDLYDGNTEVIDNWLTALNDSANKNYTLADVETLLSKSIGDQIRVGLKSSIEAETTVTPGSDYFLKTESLNRMLGNIAKRRFNVGKDGKNKGDNGLDIVDILIQDGSIKTKAQLDAAVGIVKANESNLAGDKVNLLSASAEVAQLLKQHPATKLLDPRQTARWNEYRSAKRLLDNTEGYLSDYEGQIGDFANGEIILSTLESGVEMTFSDRTAEVKRADQYANEKEASLEIEFALLQKYGPALRKDEYARYKKAIEQASQALNAFNQRIRAVDENPAPADNSATSGATSSSRPSRVPTKEQRAEMERQRDIKEIEAEIARLKRPAPRARGSGKVAEAELLRRQALIEELEQKLKQLKGS